MVKKLMVLASVMCLGITVLHASGGTSGAQILKLISAPRPAAMGGAFGAVSGDVNCMSMNPSGLSSINKKQLILAQNSLVADINNQVLAFGMPIGNAGVFGLGINMLSYGSSPKTGPAGEDLGTWGANDTVVTLAYAKGLGEKLDLGMNFKVISLKIDDTSASSFGIDLGGMYKISSKVDMGLTIQNVGGGVKFINESDPLPMNIKVGSKFQLSNPFMMALDVNLPNDTGAYVGFGLEYYLPLGNFGLPLRMGYRSGLSSTGGMAGLGVGVGFDWKSKLGIDIGWTPMGDLGDSFKVGMNFNF